MDILISDIKLDSTCVNLNLPRSLACSNCVQQYPDPLQHRRKKRKSSAKQRHLSQRSRCLQYWDTSWANSSPTYLCLHQRVRRYLAIQQHAQVERVYLTGPKKKETDSLFICSTADSKNKSSQCQKQTNICTSNKEQQQQENNINILSIRSSTN